MLKLNTIFCLISLSVLAMVHYLSLEFYLYWRYLWLDIPVHALGGMVVALTFFVPYDLGIKLPRRWLHFWQAMSFVLIVVLGWEVYEILIGVPIDYTYMGDTALDIIMGLIGGMIGFGVGKKLYELNTIYK